MLPVFRLGRGAWLEQAAFASLFGRISRCVSACAQTSGVRHPSVKLSLVWSLSRVQLLVTPWTAARQASLAVASSWSRLKLVSIESVMPSSHLILCRPLLLLPSIFPSIRVFSDESALCIRWPKYWSFSISPSSENSGLISFRMDWLDLLAVPGTLKIFSNTTVQKFQFFDAHPSL